MSLRCNQEHQLINIDSTHLLLVEVRVNTSSLNMSLTTLPILPLEAIISYLDFSSIVSLANSHPSLAHLQPKEQNIIGEDFCISGEGGCTPMPHFPEPYFDVRVETKGLQSIQIVWEWKGLV